MTCLIPPIAHPIAASSRSVTPRELLPNRPFRESTDTALAVSRPRSQEAA